MDEKEKLKKIKLLVKKYKQEIEDLKANDSFTDNLKIQSVCILREIVNDLEQVLNATK